MPGRFTVPGIGVCTPVTVQDFCVCSGKWQYFLATCEKSVDFPRLAPPESQK